MNYYFLLFQFLTIEIWKDIPGYEGKYQVSSFGRIMNTKRGTIRKPRIKDGYHVGELMNKYIRVHRLVGLVFIDNPESKPFINHITGIRNYNYWWALEWCTHLENVRHENVNRPLNSKAKKVGMYSMEGVYIRSFISCLLAAKEMGLMRNHITDTARGERKSHGGYIWKYI